MNAALALTVGMARSWVTLYTTRLPLEIREARRSEIDSDLWEQQWLASRRGDPAIGTAIEVLARMLFGIISDITWRAQAGASARADRRIQVNESWTTRGLLLFGLAVAALPIVVGAGVVLGGGDGSLGLGAVLFGIFSMAAGAAVLAGLLTSSRSPIAGMLLVGLGALAIAAMWYWMLVITIPIGIALVAIAFFRARQTGWPRGAGTA